MSSFQDWNDVPVVLVSADLVRIEAATPIQTLFQRTAQIVAYASNQDGLLDESTDYSSLFSVILTSAPERQIALTVERAFEFAEAKSRMATSELDSVYRKLFQATTSLQNAENLTQLVERTCREVAAGCGFNRAVLIVGDQKYHIHLAYAYHADGRKAEELNELLGRPLVPFFPGTAVTQVGKGFRFDRNASETALIDQQQITLSLERQDGTVLGFLTLDQPSERVADIEGVSEPVALLLRLVSTLIETNAIRAQVTRRPDLRENTHAEKSTELRQAQ